MFATHIYDAILVRVIDADTVVMHVDTGFYQWRHDMRLRLVGINAPEMNTEAGKAAKRYVDQWFASNPKIVIETIKDSSGLDKADSFGRYLAAVYARGNMTSLNSTLLAEGHAVPYRV